MREIVGVVNRLDGQRVGPLGRDFISGLVGVKVDPLDAEPVARNPIGVVKGRVKRECVDDQFPILDGHRRVQFGRDAEVGDLCLWQDVRVADRHVVHIGTARVVGVDQIDGGALRGRGVDSDL